MRLRRPGRTRLLGSLQARLLAAAFGFVALALVGAGLSVGFVLHRFVRGQIDGRLDDRVLALAADPDAAGSAQSRAPLDGPPFDRPRSGWYWQVRRGESVRRSASLEGRDLAVPETRPRREGRPAPADGAGPWGEGLVLRVLVVPGRDGAPAVVAAASAPVAALRGPVIEAFRTLALCLALIGAFLAGAAVVQVRLGLRPLAALRRQLAEVRAGARDRLPAEQPREVAGLVAEMNGLLDSNAASLAGARAQVANLAHGLKTPLATLSLALSGGADPEGRLAPLVAGMDRRVRHHLARARAGAVAGPARARADLFEHASGLRAALLRIHAGKALDIALAIPPDLGVACDPQDLDEMLGNLVENACLWCAGVVRVSAEWVGSKGENGETGARGEIRVRVEDDGPGLTEAGIAAALQRGRRLDEATQGHGFGLPIAAELAGLYGGRLDLGRSAMGGLRAELTLPG